jgi:hypothetical protein
MLLQFSECPVVDVGAQCSVVRPQRRVVVVVVVAEIDDPRLPLLFCVTPKWRSIFSRSPVPSGAADRTKRNENDARVLSVSTNGRGLIFTAEARER